MSTSGAVHAERQLQPRTGWRPAEELDPSRWHIGGGPIGGVPGRAYAGPWPIWPELEPATTSAQMGSAAPTNGAEPSLGGAVGAGGTVVANASGGAERNLYTCQVVGECEPCPEGFGHYPYCLPYGNRRAVQCTPIFSEASSPPSVGSSLPGWEACGKVVAQERADFFEFVACQILLALGALYIFFRRQRTLAQRQYTQLSARIDPSIRDSAVSTSRRVRR